MANSNDEATSKLITKEKSIRFLNNGCSRHMTGDKSKFQSLMKKSQGHVTYGDNNKGKILGLGTIQIGGGFKVQDVLLVEGLKHNLLSIS